MVNGVQYATYQIAPFLRAGHQFAQLIKFISHTTIFGAIFILKMAEEIIGLYFDQTQYQNLLEPHQRLRDIHRQRFTNDLRDTQEGFLLFKVISVHFTIALVALALLLAYQLNLVFECLGVLLISLNLCTTHIFLKYQINETDLRKYSYPLLAPTTAIALRLPFSSHFLILSTLFICYSLYNDNLLNKPQSIVFYICLAFALIICLKIDGVLEVSWKVTLAIHHLFVLFSTVFMFFNEVSDIHKLYLGKVRRKKAFRNLFYLLVQICLLWPAWLSVVWLYVPSILNSATILGIVFDVFSLAINLYLQKQFLYALTTFSGMRTVSRRSQFSFARRAADNSHGREVPLCIRCYRNKALIVLLRCMHLCYCWQCLQKSSHQNCPICGSSIRRCKKIVLCNQLQNNYFKIKLYSEGDFKLYPI